MSVGFCSPPLGYIRGFRRSFQDRMSAQPGFILCPPNNLALHRLLLYTFYSAPYLHNIVLFTRSHHTFEDFILCRQKSYTLVYFGCPVGNAHPYHSPQPTYILRSKISSAFCAGQPRYSTLLLTTTALKFTLSLNPSNRVETNAKTLPSCILHSTWQLGLKHVFVGPLPTYVRLSGKRQT